MSLIVFVSTEAGIVVVGDRATTDARFAVGAAANLTEGTVKGASKVFVFDDNTVFGVTGLPVLEFVKGDGTTVPAFNAAKLIIEYGRTHPYSPDSDDFWEGMTTHLIAEMMSKAPPGRAFMPPA